MRKYLLGDQLECEEGAARSSSYWQTRSYILKSKQLPDCPKEEVGNEQILHDQEKLNELENRNCLLCRVGPAIKKNSNMRGS